MLKKFLILFVVFYSAYLYAQEFKSIMQRDYERNKSHLRIPSYYDESGIGILPLVENKGLSKSIYGYLPDWEYQAARQYLNYNLLTHISAFDFNVSGTGSITNPSYWPWTDLINAAHAKGVKIILTAVCFNSDDIHTLLTNSTSKQNFFNEVKSRIVTYKLDGVNIDFEGMVTADRGSLLNNFMLELTNFIHTNLPGKEVSFAGPAVNWGGWDLNGLVNSCDYVFIMGYDFYGSWSTKSGPSAPLTGGTYNITNTINNQYALPTITNPQKLILGVPYYGNKWKTQTLEPNSNVIEYIGSTRFKNDIVNSAMHGLLWSANQTVWYKYVENNENYQVWFDNDSSLGLKYQLAQSKNYKGVGMWALGYDNGRQELWNELKKRFFITGNVNLIKPNGGEAYQAQSVTNIQWTATNSERIKIEYTTNNGNTWSVISDSYPSDSGKFLWTVPNLSSSFCKIKITDLNSDNVFDVSDTVFTIIPKKPTVPALLIPQNNAINMLKSFSFMWSNSDGAVYYHIQVARDTAFLNLFFEDSLVTMTIRNVSNFTDGRKFYWRVAARNEAGKSEFSPYFNFITKIIEPDSLKAMIFEGSKIKLSWIDRSESEEGYIIQRKTNNQSNYTDIDTISQANTDYIDLDIVGTNNYYYRVFSFNYLIKSSPSKEAFISLNSNPKEILTEEKNFKIEQNYPNPFNSKTDVKIYSSGDVNLSCSLIDLNGRKEKLFQGHLVKKGNSKITFDLNNYPSGIYFLQFHYIDANNNPKLKYLKIIYLK